MKILDISEWFQENYREVWDVWVRAAHHDYDIDFEDWVQEEYFELYMEYEEAETDGG